MRNPRDSIITKVIFSHWRLNRHRLLKIARLSAYRIAEISLSLLTIHRRQARAVYCISVGLNLTKLIELESTRYCIFVGLPASKV